MSTPTSVLDKGDTIVVTGDITSVGSTNTNDGQCTHGANSGIVWMKGSTFECSAMRLVGYTSAAYRKLARFAEFSMTD